MRFIKHELSREFDSLELYSLNDLHIGDKHTDLKLFENFKTHILAAPNRYLILAGDLINNAVKSSVSNCYSETMSPGQQKKWVIEALKPLGDRILGITSGNHENRSKKEVDNDITYDISQALNLEDLYDENGVIVKVSLGERKGKDRQISYIIYATHGSGGGKYAGSSATNLENYGLAFEGVDIFIMGHVHKKIATRGSKLIVDAHNNKVYQKDVLYIVSAAWQDYGSYAQRMMLRPGAKGVAPIYLSGKSKRFEVSI